MDTVAAAAAPPELSRAAYRTEECPFRGIEAFLAAELFCSEAPTGAQPITDETGYTLVALYNQATRGANTTPRPYSFFGISQSELFAWEYWKAMGGMRRWDAATLYVQTVEQHNPDWWSLLLANDMSRGKHGLTRYATNRRKRIFGNTTFPEEDGWEREDGTQSSGEDSTESDGDFVLMGGGGGGGGGSRRDRSTIAVEDLSHVPVQQRVQLLQRELRRRQAVNRRILDENEAHDTEAGVRKTARKQAEARAKAEKEKAAAAEKEKAAAAKVRAAAGTNAGTAAGAGGANDPAAANAASALPDSDSFADRLRKLLAAPAESLQLAIQKRLDELDAAVGLGPNADDDSSSSSSDDDDDDKGEGEEKTGARTGGGVAALEAELKRREERERAAAEAEAVKLSSEIAEAIASPLTSPKATSAAASAAAAATATATAAAGVGSAATDSGDARVSKAAAEAAEAVSSIAGGVLTAVSPPRSPAAAAGAVGKKPAAKLTPTD